MMSWKTQRNTECVMPFVKSTTDQGCNVIIIWHVNLSKIPGSQSWIQTFTSIEQKVGPWNEVTIDLQGESPSRWTTLWVECTIMSWHCFYSCWVETPRYNGCQLYRWVFMQYWLVVILTSWRVFMSTERNLLGPVSNGNWKGPVMSGLRAITHSQMLSDMKHRLFKMPYAWWCIVIIRHTSTCQKKTLFILCYWQQ